MRVTLEDEFGDIVRKARAGYGMKLDQLASVTGIDSQRLSSFESYELRPGRSEVESIASALELNAQKLWDIATGSYAPGPEPWKVEPRASVTVIPVDVGGYSENCYFVTCPETSRTVIFDPGGSADAVAAAVADGHLVVEAVAITHGHSDHVSGISELTRRVAIHDFFVHPADKNGLTELVVNSVNEGDAFRVGTLEVEVIHTPGHTAGSLCYRIGRLAIVGDTLFAGSVGKAAAGEYRTLLSSVRNKLFTLDQQTALLPGHGPATTVEEEIAHNPFF